MESIIAFLLSNYLLVLGVYVAGGALYALLKWVLVLLKIRRKVLQITSTDPKVIDDNRRQVAYDVLGSYEYPPLASSNKGNLTMWAFFWPFNLIYTLFADVAREAWDFLYRKFGAMLQSIATAILPR